MANNFDLDDIFDGDYFASWPSGQAPPTLYPPGTDMGEVLDPINTAAAGLVGSTSTNTLNSLNINNNNGNGNGNGSGNAPEYNANYDPRNVPMMVTANPLGHDDGRPTRNSKPKAMDSPEPTKRPPKRKAKSNPKTQGGLDDYDDDGVATYVLSEAPRNEHRANRQLLPWLVASLRIA